MRDFLRNPRPQRPERGPETGTFGERLIKCRPELLKYAKGLAKNIALAKDLVQETSLRALESHRKNPQEIKNMIAWTTTILQRLYIGHTERAYVKKEVGGEEAEEAFETAESPEPELGDALDARRVANKVLNKIEWLPKKQNEVLSRKILGDTNREISDAMGNMPVKTIEDHLTKAKKNVRRWMPE